MPRGKGYGKKSLESELRKLIYQNKIMMKLHKVNTSTLHFGLRECNDLDAGMGKVVLQDTTVAIEGTNALPLVMIPLRSIINGGTTSSSIMRLQQNGHDFASLQGTEFLGGRNLDADPNTALNLRTALHRHTSIKLLLWQLALKDVNYTISMVRFNDRLYDPSYNLTVTDNAEQDKRKLFYYYQNLRSKLTNPIIKNQENFTRDIKDDFQILWSKDYHIQERSLAHDQNHYEQVDIYKKYDAMIRYTESPTVQGDEVPGTSNADDVLYTSNAEESLSTPDPRAQIRLMITANTTLSDRDDAVNFDVASFDISLKSTYTTAVKDLYG